MLIVHAVFYEGACSNNPAALSDISFLFLLMSNVPQTHREAILYH